MKTVREKVSANLYGRLGHRDWPVLRADLEAEHGLAGHRHADTVWDLAFELSDYGITELVAYYERVAALLKPDPQP